MSDTEYNIIAIFAGQKYVVPLPSSNDATLLDLMKSVEAVIHISFDKQRIIHKGRSLTDPDALISSFGLTSGSKVMVLGSVDKLDPDEAEKLVKAKDISEAVDSQLSDLLSKLHILSQGDSSCSEVTVHVKSTIDIMERCMRTLELLDSVRLPYNCESERACRKKLVDTLQEFLVRADKLRAEFLLLAKTRN
ncbi:BAG family molecular chaperone regulator 1 isoform 3 [Schistosoma japonicum]|uniref:BAG family molecular chaperone regulator 1 isoform 3 n=1 Tax=Schistosoma japonicum TaxID=6182 RepID=A0A4Z2D1A8_SCHJA|nr:Bcl2-associated athanogene 1 [Schistosoma japonicum]KAH8851260.1 Bcl2-associated athanogene 1 [Schistosoma japonicum]TNN10178.1 BAG family molecular chaperone regulator 1 isoform 3 [Schistosoma japonicum]